MNCMICSEIGEAAHIGDQELWLCENWNCWYAHLKNTTALLLQVYVKHHQAMLKRRGRTGLIYNQTHRRVTIPLIDQLPNKRPSTFLTDNLTNRFTYQHTQEISADDGINLPDEGTVSSSTSNHTQISPVNTLDHINSETIQLSLTLTPPSQEQNVEEFIRYHFKHYGPRVTSIGLFFSLNFCNLGYNLDPQNVRVNKYKFYNYFKTLDEPIRHEIRHRFNVWIKHNKHIVERIRNEMNRFDKGWDEDYIDDNARIHGRDQDWEFSDRNMQRDSIEKLSNIKYLLEQKMDRKFE